MARCLLARRAGCRAGLTALMVLMMAAGITWAQSQPASTPAPRPGVRATGPNGEMLLGGQTEPAAKVEVPASVHGILSEVNVKEGQAVKKGQQLAKLDDALQQTRVEYERVGAEGTAELRDAENQVQFAQQELEQMSRVGSASEKQQKELAYKRAVLSVELAKEKQQQSQAHYSAEKITLDRMTLRSPIDGSVLRVNKQAGEQTDDAPVIVVVQTSKINAVFYPPKELFGKIAVGDQVPLDLEGTKRTGVVVAVDPIIDPASQIFRVKLEVDNTDGKLAAGVNAVWTWAKKANGQ